jgi:hypothetical protein
MKSWPSTANSLITGATTIGSVEAVVDVSRHAVGVGNGVSPIEWVIISPIAHGV